MNKQFENAYKLLKEQHLTCVAVCADGTLIQSDQQGIKPVLDWIRKDSSLLRDACVVDKVVGKAAAMLFVYGGIRAIYADVISEPALVFLQEHQVETEYKTSVSNIINRAGTDMCPMEKRALGLENASDAFSLFDSLVP